MKLNIIRGASGSGKSTLAKSITPHVFEADDFFMIDRVYRFDMSRIKEAHENCQKRTEKAMQEGLTPIAVANTFTRHWEYEPYVKLAESYGYEVEIHICKGEYKNVHGVPDSVVKDMRNRFEYQYYDQRRFNSLLR